MEVASLWWWRSFRTAADEYDEGLQRTPERKVDGHDSCVAGRYIPTALDITRVAEQQQSKYHTKQATQQAKHDDTQNTDDEAEAATSGCCCCCCSSRHYLLNALINTAEGSL